MRLLGLRAGVHAGKVFVAFAAWLLLVNTASLVPFFPPDGDPIDAAVRQGICAGGRKLGPGGVADASLPAKKDKSTDDRDDCPCCLAQAGLLPLQPVVAPVRIASEILRPARARDRASRTLLAPRSRGPPLKA